MLQKKRAKFEENTADVTWRSDRQHVLYVTLLASLGLSNVATAPSFVEGVIFYFLAFC